MDRTQDTVASQVPQAFPLDGIKVIEFGHMVMGPTCGLVLADLGADVLKVEPLQGKATQRLVHQGAGFFASYNRDKRSIVLDLESLDGLKAAKTLALSADVVIENLRPAALKAAGLEFGDLKLNSQV